MEKSFDNRKRSERLDQAKNTQYDLIVVGGGITGAGIALDAAIRGINTLLIEKHDFASGTSSKSTKLIHGGLRYLKQLEFGLVRETGMERAVAHKNAPHLVHPETMLLPIVDKGTFNKYTASLAISVYDQLAQVSGDDKKKSLNKEATLEREPLLREDILKSSIAYSEYRTDDARLTVELIKAARREGAEAFNYVKANDFIYEEGKIVGIYAEDRMANEVIELKATQVVSAAGPWVDLLRKKDNSLKGKSLHLTKGVHIVLPQERLPINKAVYFDAFDGRMLFAIPRGKVTYIGTSDTNYTSDLDRVVCTTADVDYLLEKVNVMFEVDTLTLDDVVSSWAGLRPLIHQDGKSPSELSRKDEIFEADSGLISIAGGKLTGFRKMAKRIIDLVQEKHTAFGDEKCQTKKYKIHADPYKSYKAFETHQKELLAQHQANGLTQYDAWYLTTTYGKSADAIVANAVNNQTMSLPASLIKSEIDFAIEYESAILPEDYFNRRSGKLYFDVSSLTEHFDLIISTFAHHFGWDDAKTKQITQESKQLISDCVDIQAEAATVS